MKFFPAGMPKPLQSGYTSKHSPNILRTQMSDGYCRQRLVNQGAPDTVSVSFTITETQYRDFLSWFKGDIQCGAAWFVMPLLSVDANQSIAYRYARIQNGEVTAAVISTNSTQGTIYKLSMTLDVSNTVIDDGSWEDHYLPQGSTDDEFGLAETTEGARIADIDSVIEEDVDTGAGIGNVTTTESAGTYDEV
jgi:hypothetical protein